MKIKELQDLANKVQIGAEEKELTEYLEGFEQLEKILADFKKIKIGKKIMPMTRIDVGYLTLSDLEKITKNFSQQKVSKKTLQNNSKIDKDNFVLFRKNN